VHPAPPSFIGASSKLSTSGSSRSNERTALRSPPVPATSTFSQIQIHSGTTTTTTTTMTTTTHRRTVAVYDVQSAEIERAVDRRAERRFDLRRARSAHLPK